MKNPLLILILLLSGTWLTASAAPVAANDAARTPIGKTVAFSVIANDTHSPIGNTVDFNTSTTTTPRLRTSTVTGQGTFTADNGGNVTFVPAASFSGACTTNYFVRDPNGVASNFATITVTVGVVTDDLVLVTFQTSRVFRPTNNDVPASGFSFDYTTLDLNPAAAGIQSQLLLSEGKLEADIGGNVTFTPFGGYIGSVPDVPYTIADNQTPAHTSNVGYIKLRVGGRPFGRTSDFYQISQVANATTAPANLYKLTRNTTNGQVNYTATMLYSTGVQLNAMSLNAEDGYLYAIGATSNTTYGPVNLGHLYQLNQDNIVDLGLVPGLPTTIAFSGGTADNQGNCYVAAGTAYNLYRINLSSFTTTVIPLADQVRAGDLALDPVSGDIFASNYANPSTSSPVCSLYRVSMASTDPDKPVVEYTVTGGEDIGSLFFDATGTLYATSNQGSLYLYNLTGGAFRIGASNTSQVDDGASCPFPVQMVDVMKEAGTVVRQNATTFDIPYTIRLRNSNPTPAPNVQVNEFLYSAGNSANTSFPGATSVAILTAPTVTGDLLPASVNPTFTGQGNDAGLLLGTQSLQAGESGTIAFTVRVTYPTGGVPLQALNTAYASAAAISPNLGYQRLSNGVIVSPEQVLASDLSTNGSTMPALGNGDAPSPTPVYFTPLPVTLREFTAVAAGSAVRVAWATASESNNDHFEVERAAENGSFVKIGTVAGHGTSIQGYTYGFVDAGAARAGTQLYYRLRQVDTDGTATYSPVRVVNLTGNADATKLVLYPTPASGTATLDLTSLPSGTYPVAIYDLTGRELAHYSLAGGQAHLLDLTGLPLGVSLVRVEGQTLRLLHQE